MADSTKAKLAITLVFIAIGFFRGLAVALLFTAGVIGGALLAAAYIKERQEAAAKSPQNPT